MEHFEKQVERNLVGLSLEKKGKISEASKLYELNVREGFTGNHPYDRLVVIYSKQSQFVQAERVLLEAIKVFEKLSPTSPRMDIAPKLERFRNNLEKVRKKMLR